MGFLCVSVGEKTNLENHIHYLGWDRLVSIATCYGLDRLGIDSH